MADVRNPSILDGRTRNPFRSWDAFDRLFDEALSRSKSPGISSPPSTYFPEPRIYTDAGTTPYASGSPAASESSNESFGMFSGPDDLDRDDPFNAIWNEGLRETRRSTVTTTNVRRSKRTLESLGSNSTSTSNSTSYSSPGLPVSSPPPPPPLPTVKSPKMKKRKSKVTFRDSADGRTVTATFDLLGFSKSDVHVSYQNDKVVVTWESVNTEEKTEGNRVIRERREKKYVRTLPLPDGTKFEEVKASMDGRHLVLTYPKFVARNPVQVIELKMS